jgi:hypothetical protein
MHSNDIRQIPRATLQELGTMREVSGELNPEFIDTTMTSCTHLLLAEIAAQLAEGSIPLRDRFAMAAMQGLFSASSDEFWISITPETKTAQQAYMWADAMMKAREVK